MKQLLLVLSLLLLASVLMAQWHIDEGFEGITALPAGWTFIDDGDGMTWRNLSHANAHSGQRVAFVDNYLPNQNADWLITPQITINAGDSLSFYTRAWVGTENLKVYASTTGSAASNFTQQLLNLQDIDTSYQYASVSLNQFAGMPIYLGFFWQCENYGILVDDIKIGQAQIIDPLLELPESITFFEDENYSMDFTEYITVTNPANASLSVADNADLQIGIDGFTVSFAAQDFTGSSPAIFTLHDHVTGLTASDTLLVNVVPNPNVDLAIQSVQKPRNFEYQNLPFTPSIIVQNEGMDVFNNELEVNLVVHDPQGMALMSDTAIITAELAPSATIQVDFPSSFTPLATGVFSFTFEIMTVDDYIDNNSLTMSTTIVHRITQGGPDTFGYRFVDSNDPAGEEYQWIEISESGTSSIMYSVDSWGGDDNFSEPIPLGFSFPFYGSSYSTAHVDINGELLLADNSWYNAYPGQNWDYDGNMFNYMYPIPGYNQMPALIAVYWDDLHVDQGVGDVYFQSFGTEPERYTVIQWDNVRFHAGSDGESLLKFQVILHESGDIKMQYHTVATGQTGASIPHDFGQSSTIGIQNEAANAGLVYLREIVQNNTYIGVEPAGNLLHDELAILFYAGLDTQAPIITHQEVGNTFDGDVELSARIVDMSELETITLHYDIGNGWQNINYSSNSGLDYFFNLNGLEHGTQVQYYFSAVDEPGNSANLPLNAPMEYYSFKILPSASSQVLLLYSGRQDYQRIELPIYEDLLTNLNITYDIYNWEEYQSYSIPTNYKGVLVYATTGSANDQAYTLATALSNYLDAGTVQQPKNVWFASDGFASGQHAHPNSSAIRRLMSGYFRTSYIATGLGGGSNGLGGPNNYNYEHGTILALPGTQVGTANLEYPVYANSPDCIFPNDAAGDPYYEEVPYPEIGANYVYAFEDGPINGQAYLYHGVAATTVDTPSYRTMYFSFDFSQLTSSEDRQNWMQDLMGWWNITPSSTAGNETPEAITGINKIYP
ncbi:MAG TPA: choice-of-anchor J domain-containing protein, partial [Candidatus Cloacimonadota bacterium]|nr:choice-of-anchor J domain-containing protein [Candidatus Cloacimonadota bacterium]